MHTQRGGLWNRSIIASIRRGAFALAVLLLLFTVGAAQSEQGFTVLSVTPPNIVSLDQDVSGLNWQITATMGGGQSIVGSFSPQQSKSTSSGLPVSTKFPLTISAVANPETVTYPVHGETNSLQGFDVACALNTGSDCVKWLTVGEGLPPCPSGYGWRIVIDKTEYGLGSNWVVKCVRSKIVAARGSIDNPRIESSSSMTLTVNGVSATQTVGRDPTSGLFSQSAEFKSGGKTVATANCPGGLFTGNTWTNPSIFTAIYWLDAPGWKSVSTQSQLQTYLTVQDQFSNKLSTSDTNGLDTGAAWGRRWASFNADLNNLNNAAATFKTQSSPIVSNQQGVASGDQASGAFTYTGQAQITRTLCTFLLAADWVGVLIEVGKPKITSFAIQSGNLGDDVTGVVKVQNVGVAQGTFTAAATCGAELTQRFSAPQTTIAIGQSSDITLTLTTAAVGSGSCQVKVCDVARPSICDSSTATYSVTKPKLCSPGEKKLEGTVVKACKADGSGFDVLLSCSSDSFPQADSSGNFKCISNAPSKAAPAQTEQTLSPSVGGELSGPGAQSATQAAGASPIKAVGISLGGIAVAGALVMLRIRRRRAAVVTPQGASVDTPPGQVVVIQKSSVGKWVVLGLVLLLVGGGLFLVATYQQPQVTIKSVSIKNLQTTQILTVGIPTGTTISVVAEVNNPNFIGGTVERVDYDILLNGVEAGHGTLPNQVAIPANGKADVPTEVSVSFISGGQALISTLQGGGLTAKVQGSATIKPSILPFSVTVPFKAEQKVF